MQRLLAHDPVVRLDAGEVGVHQARVSIRRLRSDLKTFAPLVDAAWADALRTDLKVVADALGRVRDADVLGVRLEKAAGYGSYLRRSLPPFWYTVSLFNPVVYLVSAFRWSFFGTSDVGVAISLAATVAFLVIELAVIGWIFRTGYRLKS